jgi:LPXTG-motif cell wall-anchored protein
VRIARRSRNAIEHTAVSLAFAIWLDLNQAFRVRRLLGSAVIAGIAVAALVAGSATPSGAVVPTATSTTVVPLLGMFAVWPPSGPAGTPITVSGNDSCRSGPTVPVYALVTFTAIDEPNVAPVLLDIEVSTSGGWEGTFTVPPDAPPTRTYAISARCVHAESTIFYYQTRNFDVTVEPAPTSTTTPTTIAPTTIVTATSTSTSMPETTTVDVTTTVPATSTTATVVDLAGSTTVVTVAASESTLPRTGSGGTSGLLFLGGVLLATGAALLVKQRRS